MKIDYKNWSSLRIFAAFYKNHIGLFILDMVCALAVAAVDLIFPYISKQCMEVYLPENAFKTFFIVMSIMIAAYIVRSVLYYIITYWGHRMGVGIETDMRETIFNHIEDLSYSFFDKNRTGKLLSRVTNDLFEISELAHHGPEDFLISIITIFGAFFILLGIEWRLALIVFAIIPAFVVFTIIQRNKMTKASMAVKSRMAEINASVEGGFSGIRTAKAFANEKVEKAKFKKINEEYFEIKKDFHHAMAIFHSGMEFAMSILSVLVIMVGGYYIMGGTLSYIGLVTFSLYISTFINPIRKLGSFVEQYVTGMAGFKRFLEIMRTDPEITDKEDAHVLENVKGNIELKHVYFSYKGRHHAEEEDDGFVNEVLKDVSFDVKAGTTFALVGPSGGGKTTISNLIPRFYDVNDGEIIVDGFNIKDVTQHSLRKSIGIVQQDVFMFAGTIRDNILYGKPDATEEEIFEAAKRAEIHDEILAMKDGYDSYVGERGVMLSGGQKQRIGIARVFLKNPPIIILDEATSALDSVTEMRIQNAFDELAKGRTSIIIAHRLSTIRNADKIAVIDNNQIMEIGSHDELIKKNGEYKALVNAQMI